MMKYNTQLSTHLAADLLLLLSRPGLDGLHSVCPAERLAEIFPGEGPVNVHPAAVLPLETLLPLGKTFLPLPQLHPVLWIGDAVHLLHGPVVLHVGVGGHSNGLALLLLRDLNNSY